MSLQIGRASCRTVFGRDCDLCAENNIDSWRRWSGVIWNHLWYNRGITTNTESRYTSSDDSHRDVPKETGTITCGERCTFMEKCLHSYEGENESELWWLGSDWRQSLRVILIDFTRETGRDCNWSWSFRFGNYSKDGGVAEQSNVVLFYCLFGVEQRRDRNV